MTRLQKKCLVVSLCFHGVVMGALVVTAAFRSEPAVTSETVLMVISPNIVDRAGAGGPRGSAPQQVKPAPMTPTPVAPAPAPPAPRAQPTPAPTAPITHPLPTEPSPAPKQAEPPKTSRLPTPRQSKQDDKPVTSASNETTTKHKITPDLSQPVSSSRSTSRNATTAATSSSDSQAERNRRIREIESALASLSSSYNNKEPESKVVPLPGLDDGETFVGYRTAIFNAYYHAWNPPDSSGRKNAVADVKIVVARDGSIISAEFVSKSEDAAIDRSVKRALDAVPSLPPFPAGATDTQRTFIIRFNLEAKESAG